MGQVEHYRGGSRCDYICCAWEMTKCPFTWLFPPLFLSFCWRIFFSSFAHSCQYLDQFLNSHVDVKYRGGFSLFFPFHSQCVFLFGDCPLRYLSIGFQRLLCYFTKYTMRTNVFAMFLTINRTAQRTRFGRSYMYSQIILPQVNGWHLKAWAVCVDAIHLQNILGKKKSY